jgi:hypothetical protein
MEITVFQTMHHRNVSSKRYEIHEKYDGGGEDRVISAEGIAKHLYRDDSGSLFQFRPERGWDHKKRGLGTSTSR